MRRSSKGRRSQSKAHKAHTPKRGTSTRLGTPHGRSKLSDVCVSVSLLITIHCCVVMCMCMCMCRPRVLSHHRRAGGDSRRDTSASWSACGSTRYVATHAASCSHVCSTGSCSAHGLSTHHRTVRCKQLMLHVRVCMLRACCV